MRLLRSLGTFTGVVALTVAVTLGALVAWPVVLPQYAPPEHDPVVWPVAVGERTVPRPADPVERITIVAVGDLMVHTPQLSSAKTAGGYDFTPCFSPVSGRLSAADLAIGNLETVLAGGAYTGYPSFNSPDSFAEAAVKAGFDVLTTANNHTLDRGPAGLVTTLEKLDAMGVLHTGTARTEEESNRVVVADVKGVKVAVLAYTYGTNGLTAPAGKPWMVNTISEKAMVADVQAARALGVDLVLVSIHNGTEYERQPSAAQAKVERAMIDAGADVVLGSHPHVLQPLEIVESVRADGTPRTAFIIHSLGNFISNQRERYRDTGLILRFVFEKNLKTGVTSLASVEYVPVWVDDTIEGGKAGHRVLPIADVLADQAYSGVTSSERAKVQQAWDDTTSHLGSAGTASADTAAVVFYEAPAE